MAELLDKYLAEWRAMMLDVADAYPELWDTAPSDWIYTSWGLDSGYLDAEDDEADRLIDDLCAKDLEMANLVLKAELRAARDSGRPGLDPDEESDEKRRESLLRVDELLAALDDWDSAQLDTLWVVHSSYLQQ